MALSCVSQKRGMLGRLALVTGGQKLSVKPRVSPGEGQGLKALPWWSPFTRTLCFSGGWNREEEISLVPVLSP